MCVQEAAIHKAKSFFEYLLALNNLVGKVTRDYKQFEKNWSISELEKLDDCFLFEDCEDEDTLLEIHKVDISSEDEIFPEPPSFIKDWLTVDYSNEETRLIMPSRILTDEEGTSADEKQELFTDDPERVNAYQLWERGWNEWADRLKSKKRAQRLYGEFFDLIQQMEREGEALEFIYGKGIFCWEHRDEKIGTIRAPLLTIKLELDLDADKGVITARRVGSELAVEREMFSGVRLPNTGKVKQLTLEMEGQDILDDQDDFFNQFVQLVDAKGEYIADKDVSLTACEDPVIYDQSLFSLRRKSVRVLRDDLEAIISGITAGQLDLSETITGIIGEATEQSGEESERNDEELAFTSNELYFPLDANEQQKEIVNRIERHYGVSVQGPPGTGKTHTIANLVSHFLAQGKKVLITSQKESPLKVLKSKIPEEIRDLCVPVLGGGRESLQEIEKSIRVIGEKLGELNPEQLAQEITREKVALDESKRNEARLKNLLLEYAKKEGQERHFKGEVMFKYDVAKRLSETATNYRWLQDEISIEEEFPISKQQFQELWQLKSQLKRDDLVLRNLALPSVNNHVRNQSSFEDLINEGEKLEKSKEKALLIIEKYQLQVDHNFIEKLLKEAKALAKHVAVLSNEKLKLIIEDSKAGGAREERWRTLILDLKNDVEQLRELHHQLITHKIELPNKSIDEITDDIKVAKGQLQTGKKPNFWFFLFKGKQTKYLFEAPVVNGRPIQGLNELEILESHVRFLLKKEKAARIFNGHMIDAGLEPVSESDSRFINLVEDQLNELTVVMNTVDVIEQFKKLVTSNHFDQIDFYKVEQLQQLTVELEIVNKYHHYLKWFEKYEQELEQLKGWSGQEQEPIWQSFYEAFYTKNKVKWGQLLTYLEERTLLKERVIDFYKLVEKVANILPLTSKWLELSVGGDAPFPDDYKEAFDLRKLQTWLDETKDVSISKIKEQIEEEHKVQKRLIGNIVSKATWKNQVERITEQEKRALSAWKSYIKRFGKGSGKYAHVNLQGAREQMKTAQTAIPVWVMPVNQVLENFPVLNEKFDVVIFDESSQCDIFSINVLMRAKKVIVVGDDEQISPQAIGTKLEDVHELVRRYLDDIPNGGLFDGNISLYEIAEQTFPKEGKLMLREHFRCVPEIIQFSNDLSYDGQMIPLRLPLEEEKIDPPVWAVKVEDGYNDEREKDINVPEVDAIVSDMQTMINDPTFEDQTFGVIAMQGQKQAKLLETRIREGIGDKEFVKRKIICGNSYTLQGDDRDIIFLSLVVAPNRRFMSLTKTSDKQRFNVAASRAKNQMRLYHSVDLEQLKSDDLRYRLLSYCKNPSRVIETLENLEEMCDSPFEVDVLKMILARGYKVTPQVVVGHYRIDFVIEGLRDRLAVECDGEKWHGPEKFEEDMRRQESLERAGWKFWRVRGRDFYFDKKQAMESLWKRLEELGIEPSFAIESEVGKEESSLVEGKD